MEFKVNDIMKLRFTYKTRTIAALENRPSMKEYIVWDNKYNCSVSSTYHEPSAIKLCNNMETAHRLSEKSKK